MSDTYYEIWSHNVESTLVLARLWGYEPSGIGEPLEVQQLDQFQDFLSVEPPIQSVQAPSEASEPLSLLPWGSPTYDSLFVPFNILLQNIKRQSFNLLKWSRILLRL